MVVVQVGGDRVDSKSAVIQRQVIYIPHQNGLPIGLVISRAWSDPVEAPNRLRGELRGHGDLPRLLDNLIEHLRGKLRKRLMTSRATLERKPGGRVDRGVWAYRRCRA